MLQSVLRTWLHQFCVQHHVRKSIFFVVSPLLQSGALLFCFACTHTIDPTAPPLQVWVWSMCVQRESLWIFHILLWAPAAGRDAPKGLPKELLRQGHQVRIYVCECVCVCECVRAWVCVCVRVRAFACVCVCVRVRVCERIQLTQRHMFFLFFSALCTTGPTAPRATHTRTCP